MRASIEVLSGIIRVGENTDHYGDKYEFAVAFSSTDGKTAVVKALTSTGSFTLTHARAVIAKLKSIGLEATWERIR